jgi:DsbC/DsbD-like thiol-disulfide interchange protein
MRKFMLIPLALVAVPSFAVAQSFDDLAQLEVLTGWRTDTGIHMAGVEISLAPGWVTYWRAPGDAGIPPQFSFVSDDTIQSITPHWPTPQVFGENGIRSIGYYDKVVFPLTVDVGDTAGPVSVSGELTIGVCEEICIPVTFEFDAVLPASGSPDSAITTALAAQARTQTQAGVGAVTCAIDPISDGLRLKAVIDVPPTAPTEHVVIEASDPRIWVSEADVVRNGNQLSATVDMVHPSGGAFAFDRSGVRITVLGAARAVDIRGCSAD